MRRERQKAKERAAAAAAAAARSGQKRPRPEGRGHERYAAPGYSRLLYNGHRWKVTDDRFGVAAIRKVHQGAECETLRGLPSVHENAAAVL